MWATKHYRNPKIYPFILIGLETAMWRATMDKLKQRYIIFLILFLAALSLIGLILGVISKIPIFLISIPYLAFFKDTDFFTLAAVLIAAISILHQSHKIKLDKIIDASKFYLDKYIQACELILKRLEADTPKRRIAWVSAASIAKRIKKIESKIAEQPDKDFLEIYQRNFAHLLTEFIIEKPSAYYYGLDGVEDMNQAYKENSQNQLSSTDGLVPDIKGPSYIDKKTILEVLSIIEPIWMAESEPKWKNGEEFLKVIKLNLPELYNYLEHLDSSIKKDPG